MRHKHAKPWLVKEVRSDINVTPLVDVCLVLLIIFMVVTPMLQKGVDITLPETKKPDKMPEGAKQMTVAVKADGSVYINTNWVTNENVKATLTQIHTETPDKTIVIKADKRAKYRQVRKVMEQINDAGFNRVGVVTEKRKT
jgi:TolR protein